MKRKTAESKDDDQERYAIKTVWKSSVPDNDYLRKEIEILLSMDHKNIIKCYEVYEDVTSVHFVFELIRGGELFDFIINSALGRLDEKMALSVFMQMVDAVHIMHSEGFMHRDIKPENFLVYTENGRPCIKLIDFGFASDFRPGDKFSDKVGSINYIAPEMISLEGTYDYKVDIWALGICLYNMLSCKQPFADDEIEELARKIREEDISFEHSAFTTVNHKIKKLIEHLLNKDPEKRLSAGEIKITPWIAKFIGADEVDTQVEDFDPKKNVKNIQFLLKFKKNMKPEFWEFCLNNLSQALRNEVYVRKKIIYS